MPNLCAEPGCQYYAGEGSKYCSRHSPEGKIREAERAAEAQAWEAQTPARRAKAAKEAAKAAKWFNQLPPSKGPPKYLVLGAAPDEEKRGRTHYNDPNVWLLDNHTVAEGTNTSRYIQADYSAREADQLRKIAQTYEGKFNQIAFDYSTTCEVHGGSVQSLTDRFESFYTMLKPNGIFILPDCGQNTEAALEYAGFSEVRKIQVKSLGDKTIISELHFSPESWEIIAIKGGSNAEDNNAEDNNAEYDNAERGGGAKKRSKRKSVRRRNLKLRKSRKN